MAETIHVELKVNGQEVRAEVPGDLSLMRFLRDYLRLTGAKDGCSSGHCGACTVILNGKATRSCLVRMAKVNQARVETIEGLARDGQLHPIQQAFVEHGAVQCGFCSPGMIMAAKALLDANPQPSPGEIRAALTQNRNMCRCTGYVKIVEAIQDAAQRLAAGATYAPAIPDGEHISATMLSRDAVGLVTGSTRFGDDVQMEGMLHGKILWATHPHAEILNIDTSEAQAMEGVALVVTARDIPGKNQAGLIFRDQPAIAADKVRYIGDSLAAAFAESREIAEAALKRIRVEYRPLPGVFSPEEAAQPDAPRVHAIDKAPTAKGNLLHHAKIERGDVEAAFQQCAVVVEETYTTPFIEHGFLEPESGIAFPSQDGGVTLHIGTQCAFDDRTQLSEILNMPEEKIRVVQLPMGGAFGGKEDMILQQYLALGALLSGRPVKMVLTREESLRVHVKRHPAWMRFKTGADRAGHVLAVEADITLDTGVYASLGVDVLENTLVFGAGPYYVPNVKLEGWAWYTNNVLAGAMRGFGANQVAFALEQQMDAMARALGIDPFEFRMINALDVGLLTAADHVLEEGIPGIKETIQAARERFRQVQVLASGNGKRIGVGVACAVKNIGYGHALPESAGAILELDARGCATLRASQHEYGQGARAALVQLVARELGVKPGRIELIGPDTALTPPTGPTTASRQTFLTGNAVVLACQALKQEIFSHAAEVLEVDPAGLELRQDRVVDPDSGREVPLGELGERFVVERRYTPPRSAALLEGEASHLGQSDFESRPTHWCYAYNTQVAVVEVDTTSGEVRVLTVISANDVGKIINRQAIEGQIHGGVMMGLGYALSEEFVVERGINLTDSLHKCRLPTADQTPDIIPVIVEVPHPLGPQGAKGFAEAPSLATAPAIVNAIYDAIGVRITALPADKKRIKAALRL
jgi:CO/xanthine dehydrogenase Mo-binding subunit/aerobic-type carbon monoxide dehydrogenase small subunit (CoxS/CutS family)